MMQPKQQVVEIQSSYEKAIVLEFDALRVLTASLQETILALRRDEMAAMEAKDRPLTPLQTQVLVNAMSFGLFDAVGRIDIRRLSALLGAEPLALRRTLIEAQTRVAARFLQEIERLQP
jgi:predicted DNA binding protein